MKTAKLLLAAAFLACPGFAELTMDQRVADFRRLAALYDKQYAPYEWKKTLFGFDALDVAPWLARVRKTTNDLDFYELCVEYVASLNDTHDSFSLPSDFLAAMGLTVDIYDGKVLVEAVNTVLLPARDYPIAVGDEIVSVDGVDVEQLLATFARYAPQSNPRSNRRLTAPRIVTRPQSRMPHAVDTGDKAAVVFRKSDGSVVTLTIPWTKTGTPMVAGRVPSPKSAQAHSTAATTVNPEPAYLTDLLELQTSAAADEGVLGYGARNPIFDLPAGFTLRLGRLASDFFYSGTFQAGGYRIGYIRIPNYAPPSQTLALTQFETEMAFFQANTDGLIVDEMRNTGGNLCFGENIAARLIPYPFHTTAYEIRATRSRVNGFYAALESARARGADSWVIDLWEALFNQMYQAYTENRGRTGPLPICSNSIDRQPAVDRDGKIIAYTKPIIMIIDEFSTSTADSVAAMFQDAGRGLLAGFRSNGAGGNNTSFAAGAYSEGVAGMTLALQVRANPVVTTDYPASTYIENVGVRPEVEIDYMKRENLLQRGKPFVDAVTARMVDYLKNGK
ncbi:MAG: hypothetical protein HYX27_18205 [Acidobacteria bacterium]|nr:hypothetical protein [Acidobacteriota bacterium]